MRYAAGIAVPALVNVNVNNLLANGVLMWSVY